MGVPRRACGGRRSPKKFVLWAVVVVGFFALSVKDVRESVYESPGDGKKETREMMDGNDDGKMMGGADNEGESEIEINEKPKIEKQKVMSKIREQKKNGDGDGDGERKQDENNGDHSDDGDENVRDNNDDDDNDHDRDNGYSHNEETNINGDIEKNNQKIDQIIAMNEKESETKDIENPRETNIEDKQEKDKDEEEKRENQQGEEVVVNEIKPDQDKPIDEPEIDDRNRMENGNSAGEENGGREEEKENKEMEEGKDVGKRKGGGGRGGDGGNEKEGKEGNYGEEEKGNGKEKEEGNYEGAEKGNKEDEGKDGRMGEGEKGNKEDEGKDAGKGGGEKENKEGKDRGKGGEGEKENKENEGKDAGKGEGAGEGEKDAKEKEEKGKEEEEKEEGKEAPPWKSSVALNGNLARNENLNGRPVVKVLLLAYQRSGSSFTGELLSSGGGAFYVYEPLFQWRHQFGYAPDPAFHQDIPKLLGDLLDCSPEVLNAWKRGNFRHFRRKPEGVKDFCKDASFRLVKTIRARKSHVLPWLLLREDIKVVHLVRDPRGILNSVSHGGNIWTDRNRDAVYQCTSLSEDLDLEQLGPQRYLRMRYEDLVDKPLEETTRVFSFMGVPVSSSVLTFLKEHTGMDTAGSPLKQRYMNTFRQADFRHDHWKKELDSQHIRQIEDVCQVVMNFLHYPVLPSA